MSGCTSGTMTGKRAFSYMVSTLSRLFRPPPDLEGWGFAPKLSFDKDDNLSAQLEVELLTLRQDMQLPSAT